MNNESELEGEVVSILASYQSIFFGVDVDFVLFEIGRRVGEFEKAKVLHFVSLYRPLVQELYSELEKYQRPTPEGAVLSEDSFDAKRLACDVATRHVGANPEFLERIVRQIVYWRYLR